MRTACCHATCGMGNIYRFIEPAVLRLLAEKGSSYGYDLAEGVAAFALSDSPIDRSALYRTLRTLEENGFVSSNWETESAGPNRRVYSLTPAGAEHLQEWAILMERLGKALLGFSRQVSRTI